MWIQKCDLCKKPLKDKYITAGFGYDKKDFCIDCGQPVLKFLKKNKFTKEENINKIKEN